jgi:nitrogen fixation-related uncharacterized protein
VEIAVQHRLLDILVSVGAVAVGVLILCLFWGD